MSDSSIDTASTSMSERNIPWYQHSPLFKDMGDIGHALPVISNNEWPSHDDLMRVLSLKDVRLTSQKALDDSGMGYEAYIAKYNAVPTRPNWHDLFNAIIWHQFPLTKRTFNHLHQQDLELTDRHRSTRRDALTLLDECGVILAISEKKWRAMLTQHQWHEFFWQHRREWGQTIKPFVVGHALYEQAFKPFIGWCAKAVFIDVEDDFFLADRAIQYQVLDQRLSSKLNTLLKPKQLLPLPILAVPEWNETPIEPSYLAQENYFRPARKQSPYIAF
ncbi:DUF3025 domain-containing protein [Echinimonas agarilytica]|uniref:DUF3025 domain-containing protein n=1 Tax=Echinimonas agarilytica TaxID=1215918 RepID=A0AA41W683_9GAMM|nr:DUF3025 domain-containing protein [Echinimonas agarilytica]MCM2679565.1 DUF3025 domain-containing protein [Echinimonas agarilytica]